MDGLLLFHQDGTLPISSDLSLKVGGRLTMHHSKKYHGGASALPKLMHNLKLFDSSVINSKIKGGSIQNKPNLKRPIKFII
jgi:hypothetical protein